MSKWETKTLESLSEVITKGTTPTSIGFNFTERGINFIKVESIDFKGNFIADKFAKISNECHQALKRSQLQENDILFSIAGALGRTAQVTKEVMPANTNQALAIIRLKPSSDLFPKYIFHALSSGVLIKQIEAQKAGVAQQNLSLSQVKNFQIPIPPIEEQKRIVEILDKAFEGIAQAEDNTRRNLINARELFDSYLASIHSDREKLRNLVDIRTGKLNSNAAEENGIYPFFTCSRDVYRINDYAFDCEAILLAGNNASGDFNVKHYSGKFNAYQRTYVITINPEKRIAYRYLYYQLLHSLKEFKQKSVGAATKFLKIGIIQDMEIPLPNIYEQNKIVVNLDSLQTKTQKLETIYQRKLEAIAELKQSILEKAFTGQLSQ